MSSKLFGRTLHLKLHRSYRLGAVLIVLHMAALASVLVSLATDHIASWLLLLLITLSFIYYLRKYVFLIDPRSVISVTQTRQGDWSLHLYKGDILDAALCDDSYKHPLLIILNFKTSLGRFSVPLFPDALNDDLHRICRSRLTLSRPVEKEKLLRR